MKLFGEELGDVGRWYLVLPPVFLIVFLIGLFIVSASGQSRLNSANERVHESQLRQQALSEFVALMTDAESAQRGYLLTGESSYLAPYEIAVAQVESALNRVQRTYRGTDGTAEFRRLRLLTGKKLGDLQENIAILKRKGVPPSATVVGTDVGKQTMDQLLEVVGRMRAAEIAELDAATAEWRRDFRLSRWVTASGTALNILLVLIAARLVFGDMLRRARQTRGLKDQKLELEQQVAARTRELEALSTHLQGISEQEKSALARELHDELGGLLVAARMDLSWLQQRLPTTDTSIEQRFKRIHEQLSAGVDLKRRVVEELRPTLLDNMGLFTALRWQFKETCRRNGMRCTENIPDLELNFDADSSIGVFRIAQEALTNILKHADAKSADLAVEIAGDTLTLRITDDGKGIPTERLKTSTSHGLASMRHRISGLGGTWQLSSPSTGGTIVTALIPLSRMLQPAALTG